MLLLIEELQPAGKRRMSAQDFLAWQTRSRPDAYLGDARAVKLSAFPKSQGVSGRMTSIEKPSSFSARMAPSGR